MAVIFLLVALAGVIGFLLSIYLFFYRLRLNTIWRRVGGITGGFVLGSFMAIVALLIFWPPVVDFVTAGGVGLMLITIIVLLDIPKTTVRNREPGELATVNYGALIGPESGLSNKEL